MLGRSMLLARQGESFEAGHLDDRLRLGEAVTKSDFAHSCRTAMRAPGPYRHDAGASRGPIGERVDTVDQDRRRTPNRRWTAASALPITVVRT